MPAIHMEKQFEWDHKVSGAESPRISMEGQTVLVRLMMSQIWQELAGSVSLWEEGLEKGQCSLLTLMPDTSVSPCIQQVLSSCYGSAGAQRE